MKLYIDNLQGFGPRDYTSAIDTAHLPQITRRLNKPADLTLSLVPDRSDFLAPADGARIVLARDNGQNLFTGYLLAPATLEYLGEGERGPVHRHRIVALSDETLLDRKRLPDRPDFIN